MFPLAVGQANVSAGCEAVVFTLPLICCCVSKWHVLLKISSRLCATRRANDDLSSNASDHFSFDSIWRVSKADYDQNGQSPRGWSEGTVIVIRRRPLRWLVWSSAQRKWLSFRYADRASGKKQASCQRELQEVWVSERRRELVWAAGSGCLLGWQAHVKGKGSCKITDYVR